MSLIQCMSPLLDLLLPHRCAGCERLLEARGFCDICTPSLEPLAAVRLAGVNGSQPTIVAAHAHGGVLAEAIHRFKYGKQVHLQQALGALLARQIPPMLAIDRVVPVPLHPRRLRQRGFNQATLLSRVLCRELRTPLSCGVLRRVRDTRSQVGLGRPMRQANVRGAFAAGGSLEGERILLVDDVITTGATVAACASALFKVGVHRVDIAALSRAASLEKAAPAANVLPADGQGQKKEETGGYPRPQGRG